MLKSTTDIIILSNINRAIKILYSLNYILNYILNLVKLIKVWIISLFAHHYLNFM